jgi:2,4-dienoyl-CoA reductase-like NADH-dependent reductase (Old Yellow Enzyme family)
MIEVPEMLWTKAPFGRRTAANRFLAQPMEGNDGESGGAPSGRSIARYAALGRGGWGVAVMEAVSVLPESLARTNQLILEARNLDGFKRLVGAYKAANPEGILLIQLTHSGGKGQAGGHPTALWEPAPEGARLLSTADLEGIRERFLGAAVLAEEAGADGVDLKLCHGYFGAEMLRPANVRKDGWGGSFEERTRFLRECALGIRAAAGSGFLLGSRISMYEGIRGGCGTAAPDELVEDLAEMRKLVALMSALALDYVNVSAGVPGVTSELTRPVPTGKWLYLDHVRYAKTAMDCLRASGSASPGDRRPAVIQSAFSVLKAEALALAADCLGRGYADFAGFGRQQLADPETPAKLLRGEEPRWCTACSGCSRLMAKQAQVGCSVFDDHYRRLSAAGSGAP